MKVYLELDEMPASCLGCPLSDYEQTDDGEELHCLPLYSGSDSWLDDYEGNFLKRRDDCPLKQMEAL